ncbi:MAG: universal stress protein, partial [Steroidobacteraceae bacterium]
SGERHAVHAYIPRTLAAAVGSTAGPAAVAPELMMAEQARELAQLRQLTAPYDIPEKRVHLDMGSPIEIIQRTADTLHADIAVLGAISRSSAQLLFIGPTAERALERLASDVLVVKPPDIGECLPF